MKAVQYLESLSPSAAYFHKSGQDRSCSCNIVEKITKTAHYRCKKRNIVLYTGGRFAVKQGSLLGTNAPIHALFIHLYSMFDTILHGLCPIYVKLYFTVSDMRTALREQGTEIRRLPTALHQQPAHRCRIPFTQHERFHSAA